MVFEAKSSLPALDVIHVPRDDPVTASIDREGHGLRRAGRRPAPAGEERRGRRFV
jgi:hypothetical protein